MQWMATAFVQDGEDTCDIILDAKWGQSTSGEADCEDGIAVVELYAYAKRFTTQYDQAEPPANCNNIPEDQFAKRTCGWSGSGRVVERAQFGSGRC